MLSGRHAGELIGRYVDNIVKLEQFEKDVTPCEFALFFKTSEATMEKRLLGRGRGDDNAETIKNRFQTFKQQSMPAIEALRKAGKLREISADGTPEKVFAAVQKVLKKDLRGGPEDLDPSGWEAAVKLCCCVM